MASWFESRGETLGGKKHTNEIQANIPAHVLTQTPSLRKGTQWQLGMGIWLLIFLEVATTAFRTRNIPDGRETTEINPHLKSAVTVEAKSRGQSELPF